MVIDLHYLIQQGMSFTTILVPRVILSKIFVLIYLATKIPIHY